MVHSRFFVSRTGSIERLGSRMSTDDSIGNIINYARNIALQQLSFFFRVKQALLNFFAKIKSVFFPSPAYRHNHDITFSSNSSDNSQEKERILNELEKFARKPEESLEDCRKRLGKIFKEAGQIEYFKGSVFFKLHLIKIRHLNGAGKFISTDNPMLSEEIVKNTKEAFSNDGLRQDLWQKLIAAYPAPEE